ncbi:MAG TPA: ABC transporter permease [Gemmatimonadaceae bacterium]|nr:ABC transporter permease [Gemmatimonadaceae bacterium]
MLVRDLRYALRTLARAPGFALAVVLTLGLGIGANTAVFSVVRGVLLRPLPHADGDRLVYLRQSAEQAGQENVLFSVPEIIDYRSASRTLGAFAEFSSLRFNMLDHGEPVQVRAGIVTGNFFDVLGLRAVAGRTFDSRDDGPGADPVLVLTHDYWQRAFGGDPAAIGKVVRVNGRPLTIVGVVQPAPHYPERTDVFVNMVTSPHHMSATMVQGRTHRMTEVFARLAPGATVPQARAELAQLQTRVHAEHPEAYEAASGYRIAVTPLRDELVRRARLTLYLLMGTAGFVLLIACANVANLTLMRNVRRERELAVRAALGAERSRLRRLLFSESLVLAVAGAVLGLLLGFVVVDVLVAFAERFTPRAAEIRIDGAVLAFALLVATAAAVAVAFVPALPREGGPGISLVGAGMRSTGGAARRRIQRALVVTQLAVTVIVLTGAGLLARTLLNLYDIDTGVNLHDVLTMEVPIAGTGRSRADVLGLYDEMRNRLIAVPGVVEVGIGSTIPLRSTGFMLELNAEGRVPLDGEPTPRAQYRTATPEFFSAAGIPVLAGRAFDATDHAASPRVVVLNKTLADRLFPDRDPIGRRVAWTGDVLRFIPVSGDWRTVVGVVADTRDGSPDADPQPVVFQPFAQEAFTGGFVIRTRTDAAALAPIATRIVRDVLPEQPIENVMTLEAIRSESIAPRRLNAFLVGAFAGLALLIASVGIAAVLAFSVSLRTAEFGIRMSLGATPARVLRMVIGEGGALLGIGLGVGILASLGAARVLAGLLFGVAPHDPATIAGVLLVMVTVGLTACSVPALRAARVDPVEAMRTE